MTVTPCPEPATPSRDAVIEAARRFVDSLTQIPHWREHSGEDAAALVAAVQMMEEETAP